MSDINYNIMQIIAKTMVMIEISPDFETGAVRTSGFTIQAADPNYQKLLVGEDDNFTQKALEVYSQVVAANLGTVLHLYKTRGGDSVLLFDEFIKTMRYEEYRPYKAEQKLVKAGANPVTSKDERDKKK